jgi:hypothetical protein
MNMVAAQAEESRFDLQATPETPFAARLHVRVSVLRRLSYSDNIIK